MFGFTRDCPTSVNGYLSQPVSDCLSVTSHNSSVISNSRSGLMAVTTGNDVGNGGGGPNGHPPHLNHHGNHHGNHHPSHQNHNHLSRHAGHRHHHHNSVHHNQISMNHQSIFDVWGYNFAEGMRSLRILAKKFKIVAVDTEFPGVVAKVFGEYANTFEQSYHNIKVNIDLLKPIQIGFSFFSETGARPEPVSTVQFNLKWDVDMETYASDSIQLLENSGIDFEKLKRNGIDVHDFGEAFTTSGLALNDSITWIGFHSAYDWAYMLKICTNWMAMPERWTEFHKMLLLFFPRIVDIKTLMTETKIPKSGLQELADTLKVARVGAQHQAGSDSNLTGEAYFRFIEEYLDGKLDSKQVNYIYGLNYCPNGANNLWFPLNAASPVPEGSGESGNNGSLEGSSSNENSGRNSPMEGCGSASPTGTNSSS